MSSKPFSSFASAPAYGADHVAPAGSYLLQGTDAAGREWRRVFRSHARLLTAAEQERAALADFPAEERASCSLSASRIIGSGPDGYTQSVRI